MKAVRLFPVILLPILLVGAFLLAARTSAASGEAIVVNTLDDELNDNADCSLREAITAANTNLEVDACPAGELTSTDTITFSVSGTITLVSSSLPDILAAGGPVLIDGDHAITIDGDHKARVFSIRELAVVTLRNLQIINGTETLQGGGLINDGNLTIIGCTLSGNIISPTYNTALGGGIYNSGIVTITKSTLTDNHATGIQSGSGGGLYNAIEGVVYISTSAISSNTVSGADEAFGGGLVNAGKMVIASSSIYSNSAASPIGNDSGGGIYNTNDKLDISNSTISGNTGAGGLYNGSDGLVDIANSTFAGNEGSGIFNINTLTVTRSIVTDTCTGSSGIVDGGDNLEKENTCGFGTGASTDPMLDALADNGGPTLTHALLQDSPAIDAVDPPDCPLTDQRGVSRPVDGDLDGEALCDIGSYEFQIPTETTIISDLPDPSYVNQPFTVTTTVSSTIGTPTGTVTVTVGGAEAICSSSLTAGIGSCQLILTSAGTYTLEAAFGGDSSFISSTTSAEHTVIKAPSTTTILSDLPDPSMVGETIVVSFEVTAAYAIPTGKVSVYVNETSEMCSNKLVNGEASCELSISKSGLHTLTASFNGNSALNPSSDTEEHTVDQPEPTPDPFQLLFMPLVLGEY